MTNFIAHNSNISYRVLFCFISKTVHSWRVGMFWMSWMVAVCFSQTAHWYELVCSLIADFADKSWLFFESTKTIILPGVFGAFRWYLKFQWNVILQSNGYMLGYMWTFTPFMSPSVSFFRLRLTFKYSSTFITKKLQLVKE